MNAQTLSTTANALVAAGKGVLAMDESVGTCGKRLQAVGVENTEANRQAYRELLLGTEGLGQYISGAILHDETLRQSTRDGVPFVELAQRQGIIPGIKVDAGAKALAGHAGEQVTEGLDGLRERLAEYRDLGAAFCKWRAVITIGAGLPSAACIEANAHALARYAALCQEAGLVPIVEPEVLIDGAHPLDRCYAVTLETQRCVFEALYRQGVAFEGMVLKPSMVLPGTQSGQTVSTEEIAARTLDSLRHCVPVSVPGIAFLSGGQTPAQATIRLNAIARLGRERGVPWRLTFSYARALQEPALAAWKGREAQVAAARQQLLLRARLNSAATLGDYRDEMERAA